MKNANFIAIDFETATSKRYPCQLGIVVVKNGIIVERINRLIQPPNNRYTQNCINIHGITPNKTLDSPTFEVVWEEIKDYFEGNFIVAHKTVFDLDVLEKVLLYYNIPHPFFMGNACTYQLSGLSLENACAKYGVNLCNHHDGLCDAEACANLFLKYLKGEFHQDEPQVTKIIEDYDVDYNQFDDSPTTLIEDVNHFNARGYKSFLDKCANNDPFSCFTDELLNGVPKLPEFEDKRFLITGGTIFDRDRTYQIIKQLGGKKSSTVNKLLDFVILGDEPGPKKLEQLEELKNEGYRIKEITDLEFVELLKNSLESILKENE